MEKLFREVYPNRPIDDLPNYIKDNIESVVVLGNSQKVLQSPDGRKYHINNHLNELSGAEWTYWTNSIIQTNYTTTGSNHHAYNIRKIHPSPKPPALLSEIIKFFTKTNDLVLDYFMGVGGTLLAASMTNRNSIGIELNQEYIDAYILACNELKLVSQPTLRGDAESILDSKEFKSLLHKKAKLILIDPPYVDMMSRPKTGEKTKKYGKNSTPFTQRDDDLGNMSEKDFWHKLIRIVKKSLNYLENKGHVIIFIKDLQPKKDNTNLLHAKMIEQVHNIHELRYIGMKIWIDQTAKLFPYGYPYSFVATQIHQYILIFKKE